MASSVQPAFSFRSAEASGELHRRNQPAFKPYASDRPVLKKIACPTCHICVLPADIFLSVSPDSSRRRPRSRAASRLRAATTRRRSPAHRAALALAQRRPCAPAPPAQTLCAAACARSRRRRRTTPSPPPCVIATPRHHHVLSLRSHAVPPTQPRLHAFHAAAAPDQRSPGVRGFD